MPVDMPSRFDSMGLRFIASTRDELLKQAHVITVMEGSDDDQWWYRETQDLALGTCILLGPFDTLAEAIHGIWSL